MAKTFDNISEASATNYLFLFTQRTLGLQSEPPTPPPLNALGLPCHAVCLLWARLYPRKAAAHEHLSTYLSFLAACGVAAAEKARAEAELRQKLAGDCGGDDGGRGSGDGGGEGNGEASGSGDKGSGGGGKGVGGGGEGNGSSGQGEGDGGSGIERAKEKKATDKPHSSTMETGRGEDKEYGPCSGG